MGVCIYTYIYALLMSHLLLFLNGTALHHMHAVYTELLILLLFDSVKLIISLMQNSLFSSKPPDVGPALSVQVSH